jgi:hypothetical protein
MQFKKRPCCDLVSPQLESDLLRLIGEGRTIDAIKMLREATWAPFQDCKRWVDEHVGVPKQSFHGKPCP